MEKTKQVKTERELLLGSDVELYFLHSSSSSSSNPDISHMKITRKTQLLALGKLI
jgi:hypothetical protein